MHFEFCNVIHRFVLSIFTSDVRDAGELRDSVAATQPVALWEVIIVDELIKQHELLVLGIQKQGNVN